MKKNILLITLSLISGNFLASVNDQKKSDPQLQAKVKGWVNDQPVLFLENKGQMADDKGEPMPYVLFRTSAPGMEMFVTEKGITYAFIKTKEKNENEKDEHAEKPGANSHPDIDDVTVKYEFIELELKGASIQKVNIEKEFPSAWVKNYYLAHCPDGIRDVHAYEKITIRNIYPGIDWILYNSSVKGFKYDFIVHPGADAAQIKLIYRSDKTLQLNKEGNINISTTHGTLTENAPISYLEGARTIINSQFVKSRSSAYETEITYHLGNYDHSQTLVIDPQLFWSTFYGGDSFDGPMSIDCDKSGNLFAAGYGASSNLPVRSAGTYFEGTLGPGIHGDVYLWKFNNNGALLWATYYGGSEYDRGLGMCIDPSGNMFVTGCTFVNGGGKVGDFPLQNAGTYFDPSLSGGSDLFIIKLDNAGNRLWATYYGGSGSGSQEAGNSICSDAAGNVFITGYTDCTDFPVMNSGSYFDGTIGGASDAFILKFDNTGNRIWATYYGGSGWETGYAVCTDGSGNLFITGSTGSTNFPVKNAGAFFQGGSGGGQDAFISKFDNAGNQIWSTYYGGGGNWGGDVGQGICTDATGNIFVVGATDSNNFPVLNSGAYFDGTLGGNQDAFILKFDNSGTRLWATYYGGTFYDFAASSANSVKVDNCGNIYVSITTSSTDITTLNAGCNEYFDGIFDGGFGGSAYPYDNTYGHDGFFVKFTNTGTLLWATYWGGNGNDFRGALACDLNNNMFAAGEWSNYNGVNGTTTLATLSSALKNPGGGAYYAGSAPASSGETDDGYFSKFIPVAPLISTSQTNSTGCTCNGASTVTVTCTAGLFNYTWSNGSQTLNTSVKTNTVSGLCPGTYTVTVNSSCKTTTSVVTISGSTGGITLAANQSNAACFGTANGSTTITPGGGSAPYTYIWSNGQTTSSATSLSVGNYSVTVTDALGCANVKLITITQPPSISITTVITNPNCAANNSSAAISVTGGTAPYTFNWNNGQIGSTGTGLNAGTYTVTVTDNKGCTRSQNISISSPPPITLNITNSNTCPGANSATAGIIATGGTGSYTYNWSSGQTIAFVYGLGTGVYTVTVTDANGCSGTKTAIVSTYSPINVTIASTPSNCITSGTGTATVSATGGSGTYNYSWAPPVVSNHSSWPNIGQLKSGTYTVIVSDANNCSSVSTVSIGQTPPPVAGFSISPGKVICLGNTVMFTNTSGNPTVNWQLYNYTPPSNFTTSGSGNTFSYTFNTPPGVGIFNIAQSGSVGGCYFSKTDTIAVVNCPPTGPAPAAFGGGCISSGDCTKKLSAGVTGGTAPYTYKWSTGATTADIYPCPTAAGVYTLTVTDAGGFSATTTVAVSILPSSSFTPGPLATVCIGSTVNFVGATSSGATYSWTIYDTPAVSGTSANFSHAFLTAGRYPIFRSATNGSCGTQYRDTVNVINCSGPVVTTVANSVCPSSCATVTSSVTGGTAPYTYSWNNGSTTQNINPCPVTTTTYTVTIRDAGGTTATTIATVVVNPAVSVSVAPTNITCNGAANGSATATGNSGTAPFTYNWSAGVPGSGFQVSGLSSGIYTVTITDNKGCTATASATIATPPALSGQFTKGTASCTGCGCKEWLMITATGGTSPYSYSWPDGYVNRYKNQLCPGAYNVNIKDKNGCSVNVNLSAP